MSVLETGIAASVTPFIAGKAAMGAAAVCVEERGTWLARAATGAGGVGGAGGGGAGRGGSAGAIAGGGGRSVGGSAAGTTAIFPLE